jgi:hypothetical protein
MKYVVCCLLLLSVSACSSLTISSASSGPDLEYPGDENSTLEEMRNTIYGPDDEAEDDPRFSITPHRDDTFNDGIYIPQDLHECYRELDRMLHPDAKEYLAGTLAGLSETEEELFDLNMGHMGLGMYLRNYWGLWIGSRLAQYFADMDVTHPDDMSGIILDSYKAYLRNEPYDLKGAVKKHQEYWKKIQEKEMAEEGIPSNEPPETSPGD